MIEQEDYVRRVSNLVGFHEPPPNVREMIEQLHTERVRVNAAYEYMRTFLQGTQVRTGRVEP